MTDYSPIVLKAFVLRSCLDDRESDVALEVIAQKVAMGRSSAAKLESTELSFPPLHFSFLLQFGHGGWILLRGPNVVW